MSDDSNERVKNRPEDLKGEHYFDEIVNIIERLRAPGGCPWDRKQTLETLRTPITEEAYELAEAISKLEQGGDMKSVKEEAGDLLLQIVFIASLAHEQDAFDMKDIVRALCDKLIRRHPHVFGTADASDSDEVLKNWERIKLDERREKHEDLSILAGVPDSLPPLLKANRIQGKAAHVGFDWPKGDPSQLFAKLNEEVGELREAVEQRDAACAQEAQEIKSCQAAVEDELGDVLFMTVNLARYLKIDPDAALSHACRKFKDRFCLMEQMVAENGHALSDYTLPELDKFWAAAKSQLRIPNPIH